VTRLKVKQKNLSQKTLIIIIDLCSLQDKHLTMQKTITLKLLPSEAADPRTVQQQLASSEGIDPSMVSGFNLVRRSIDARAGKPQILLSAEVFINEPYRERKRLTFDWKNVRTSSRKVVIIGAGPAGLFAALKLIELGIQPIILERGKDVRERRRDLAMLNKEGILNEQSNYCFGEGGAGTYSDGKLYTRSSKRGDVNRILQLFHQFGAPENILFDSHPHIGTNKLPLIITEIRSHIQSCGGSIFFNQRVTDFTISHGNITTVKTGRGDSFDADAFILATGHSARDIFELLHSKKLRIEAKPFALGVRVEHPQHFVDQAQYHCATRGPYLPPASYSLVNQVDGKGVFSFCMCPGGIIAPAATNEGELVVNGWSPSKRNNPFANSGIVVSIEERDWQPFIKYGPLAAMYFQREVERKAFNAGGGNFVAPAQRLTDFCGDKLSQSLPDCSYHPGVVPARLKEVLPSFIYTRLKTAFRAYGRKMRGYDSNEAIVLATESRTSSPVRIPRHKETMLHPQIGNLYPCGEGAGYAGGIVSAAMDGERLATAIAVAFGMTKNKY
jgi:uncharacterized FAD-dependent dehydrogenase